MSRLPNFKTTITLLALSAGLTILPALAASTQTFTGKVSDTMCGAKHEEGMDGAACVRECVKRGGKYSLVVGDKVYVLNTDDQAMRDKLDKLAWQQATVTGTQNGVAIAVESVKAAK